jgi:ABC-type oligopeptide transport system substrate-binding subunit
MRRTAVLLAAAAAALALALAGCGSASDGPGTTSRSDRLVDFTKKPPFVNALDIDPKTKDFLLTTNRGFFRIAPDGGKVTPIKGTITAQG